MAIQTVKKDYLIPMVVGAILSIALVIVILVDKDQQTTKPQTGLAEVYKCLGPNAKPLFRKRDPENTTDKLIATVSQSSEQQLMLSFDKSTGLEKTYLFQFKDKRVSAKARRLIPPDWHSMADGNVLAISPKPLQRPVIDLIASCK